MNIATRVGSVQVAATKPATGNSNSSAEPQPRYLHGRWADFFLLGGSTLLLIPFLFLDPSKDNLASATFASLVAANVINHPHFAHSYQIFYRGFLAKLRDEALGRAMRLRYVVAGLVVPAMLIAYFAVGTLTENLRMVALGGNIMAFFVGWHYVKQGYGMLMVDCALKRQFFTGPEKNSLLYNAYAVWGASWLLINDAYSQSGLWGLRYATFAVPAWLVTIAVATMAYTSFAVALMLWRKRRTGSKLPVNGLVAYTVTLYLWTLLPRLNPFWLLVIPALHSMQYLAVVYRYQTNVERHRVANITDRKPLFGAGSRLVLFAFAGLAIGALLFWILPSELGQMAQYNRDLFGPTLFLFIFWVFVNVHHYFLDSVMWRRENPEVSQHLFS